jgi:hypothetical protein
MTERRRYADRRSYLIEAVKKRRRKIRRMAIDYLGGCCSRCGYKRCDEVLEFHHTDSSKKDFGISSRDIREAGNESKKSSGNAFFSVQTAIVRSMRACSFSGKPLLKNRVNSGKP